MRHTSYSILQDELTAMILLSGISCCVEAKNLNGLIKGSLSCSISAQKFKFDMHPSSGNKNKIKQSTVSSGSRNLKVELNISPESKKDARKNS